MTHNEKREAQQELNRWTKKYLKGVQPLIADGVWGPATKRRVKFVKYYVGWGATVNKNSSKWTSKFVRSLRHPKGPRKYIPIAAIRAGRKRRIRQRARHRQQRIISVITPGVTRWEGVPVAKIAVPILNWARRNGWNGRLNSGWRSIPYSISLCFRICGRAFCPGRCAGASTNHVGKTRYRFALDVSDYVKFAQLMRRMPSSVGPRIFNALGARDPVHFSPSGR